MKAKTKTKALLMSLCAVLLVAASVLGTMAYLTDSKDVKNTFTVGNVAIKLDEAKVDENGTQVVDKDGNPVARVTENEYKLLPGYTITKDPKATVLAGSEECWLFVKIEKSANFDQYLTYTPATGWKLVTGTDNVYARKVTTADFGTAFSVLQNDQVTVKGTVTEGMMTSLTTASYPTLTITAYATQLHKSATEDFTAVDAWAAASTL